MHRIRYTGQCVKDLWIEYPQRDKQTGVMPEAEAALPTYLPLLQSNDAPVLIVEGEKTVHKGGDDCYS